MILDVYVSYCFSEDVLFSGCIKLIVGMRNFINEVLFFIDEMFGYSSVLYFFLGCYIYVMLNYKF